MFHCKLLDEVESAARDTRLQEEFDWTVFLGKTSVLYVMPSNIHSVTGLTVLGSEVFVVQDSPQVYVYDSTSFTSTLNIMIPKSKQLRGIVSCSHNNCLYAREYSGKTIYRYDLSNDTTTKWSVSGKCWGLSVNKCYNLLVTLYDTNKIQEYTTNGSLIREISLESSLAGSKHCIQLSTGNFVISQVLTFQRICIVDMNGNIIKAYGGSAGSGVGQLINPFQLIVDSHDNILVADYSNNRVQLFSPTLTYLGDIVIPGHELNNPYALHFDKESYRLYICEFTGRRMFVLTCD